jgi:hypothetical protein
MIKMKDVMMLCPSCDCIFFTHKYKCKEGLLKGQMIVKKAYCSPECEKKVMELIKNERE